MVLPRASSVALGGVLRADRDYARSAAPGGLRNGLAQGRGALGQPRVGQLVVLEQIDERLGKARLVEVAHDPAALDEADRARLLADHDDYRVGLLGDAERGAVARAQPAL